MYGMDFMARREGGPDAEELFGTFEEADEIYGYGGNDTLHGLDGADSLYGGTGNDWLETGYGNDRVYGGGGDDVIFGGIGVQRYYGGAGNDVIHMNFYYSLQRGTAYGGAGDDFISVGNLNQGAVYGGEGEDRLSVLWLTGPGVTVRESAGSWVISQGAQTYLPNGQMLTAEGIEHLQLYATEAADDIIAGAGNDYLSVRGGANIVDAGAGDDTVAYWANVANTLEGGSGNDLLIAALANTPYFVVDAEGNIDDGNLSDLSGFEYFMVYGSRGQDFISLGAGDDTAHGDRGDDTIYGNDGNDSLRGNAGNDQLFGGAGDDKLLSGRGNDLVYGGDGNDRLWSGTDNATLFGGDGNDRLYAGEGPGVLYGGDGLDRFYVKPFVNFGALATVADFDGGEDRLYLRNDLFADMPPVGRLGADDLVFGGASGNAPQLILTYDSVADVSSLWWDRDGEGATHAAVRFLQLAGDTDVSHTDIWIY